MTEKIVEMSDYPGRSIGKTKAVPQATLRIEGKIVVELLAVGKSATEVIREMAQDDYFLINRKLFAPNCEFSTMDSVRLDWMPEIGVIVFDSSEFGSVKAALPIAKRIERAGAMGLSFDLADNPPPKMKKVSNTVLPIGVTNCASAAEYLGVFLRGLVVPILDTAMIGMEFSGSPLAFWAGRSSWATWGQGQGENRAIGAIQDALEKATALGKTFNDAASIMMSIFVSSDFTLGESASMARWLDDSTLLGQTPFSYITVMDDHRDETVEVIILVTQ